MLSIIFKDILILKDEYWLNRQKEYIMGIFIRYKQVIQNPKKYDLSKSIW